MSILSRITAWIRARWQQSHQPYAQQAARNRAQVVAALAPFAPSTAPKGTPMAAIDPSPIQALIDILAGEIEKTSAELSAATATAGQVTALQGQLATTQAALDQANADLTASQASFTDLQTKFKAQTDALAALLPAAAAPVADPTVAPAA